MLDVHLPQNRTKNDHQKFSNYEGWEGIFRESTPIQFVYYSKTRQHAEACSMQKQCPSCQSSLAFYLATCVDNIIDLQNASNRLRRQVDGTDGDQQRLHDILVGHIWNTSTANIDACSAVAVRMAISKLCDGADRIQARVFRKSVRNNFKSFSISLYRKSGQLNVHSLVDALTINLNLKR